MDPATWWSPRTMRQSVKYLLLLAMAGAASACGSSTDAGTVVGTPSPQYTLVLIPQTISIPAGARDSLAVLIARVTGFASAVALSIPTAPTGITVTFNPASTTADQTRMVLSIAATVAPGSYPLVLHGGLAGQSDVTVTLQLQVTAGTASGNV